jgi:hypothetical protein
MGGEKDRIGCEQDIASNWKVVNFLIPLKHDRVVSIHHRPYGISYPVIYYP